MFVLVIRYARRRALIRSPRLRKRHRGFLISHIFKVAVLIDGGHTRALAKKAKKTYDPDFIEKLAHGCVSQGDEILFRVLYYDCAGYEGLVKKPVSGTDHKFTANDGWLKALAAKDYFAVRRGVLKFRGWKPIKIPIAANALTDADFSPDFEQKGVDMRIGLDMATFSETKSVDRLILVSGDTDCVPAMKHARKAGLQVILAKMPNTKSSPELLWHCDFERPLQWPK